MEDVDEFYHWLNRMIEDSKEKLGMTEETIAFILSEQAALRYYRILAQRRLHDKG
jgi:hypothetical protein